MTRHGRGAPVPLPVQVFGLQRSGTHYTHEVLVANFHVKATKDDGGWRHGFPDDKRIGMHGAHRLPVTITTRLRATGITPVLVRKDLDHWLASIERLPRDVARVRGFNARHPEATWHAFYEAWGQHAEILRYEDFLSDFETATRRLGEVIGQEPRSFKQPGRVPYSADWRPQHRGRYV